MHSVGFRIDNSLEVYNRKRELTSDAQSSGMPSDTDPQNDTSFSQRALEQLVPTVEVSRQDVCELRKDVERLTKMLAQTRETSFREIRLLESELNKRDQRLAEMVQMLAKQSDYEEIKRELLVLRKRNCAENSTVLRKSILLENNETLQNELNQVKTINQQLKNVILFAQNISGIDTRSKNLLATFMHHDPRLSLADSTKPATPNSPLDLSSQPRANSTPQSKPIVMDENANGRCSPSIHSPLVADVATPTALFSNSIGAPPLDTLLVAQNVRELLAANNIGQRLFAKHVLGLSQGTVSELLSKPKTWDKLTEKGRESYRKMNLWTEEPHNITQLKSIAPKKGQIFVAPPIVSSHENHATEERVNQILQEAKVAMSVKPETYEEPLDVGLNGDQMCYREAACLTRQSTSTNSLLDSSSQLEVDVSAAAESIVERGSEAADDGHIAQCVMQPISREQFNQYSCLNTEDVVKRVKEILNRYSISQRLFGEYVLGLSQGSVSDLLARPKPWRQLTQKGHEPFIRMQIFIDDPNSISKLLAGVYSKVTLNKDTHIDVDSREHTEVDTALLAKRVGQVLAHSGVNDALFADIVLGGVSTCQVEELLRYPTPWSQLTPKVRALYTRMQAWLSSCAGVVDSSCKSNSAELVPKSASASKRINSVSLDETMSAILTETNVNNDSTKNINCNASSHEMSSKKSRVVFTDYQKRCLLMSYSVENYPRPEVLEQLSTSLELPVKTIVNWFHNHRMRCKLSTSANVVSSLSDISPSSPSSTSAPSAVDDDSHEAKPVHENDTQVACSASVVQVSISSRRKKSKPTRLIKVDPDIENTFTISCS